MIRIGTGYDVHAFAENRALVLGGVQIPHPVGLLGHSDADVLLHAVADALLGACAKGDIGKHFPDTNPKYKNANSVTLLREVREIIKPFRVSNIDATVVAQAPKLAPYIEQMRQNIATALQTDISAISVKATTTEKLGFCGRKEGIEAQAVCILTKQEDL